MIPNGSTPTMTLELDGNVNLDGWGSYQGAMHIYDNVTNNAGTLT